MDINDLTWNPWYYPAVDIEAEVKKVLDRKEKMKELKGKKKN